MLPFNRLTLQQGFTSLPSAFYSEVEPQGLTSPKLVLSSQACCELIGCDESSLSSQESLAILSANSRFSPASLAMKYTGHQFGYYNPDLGDGRGLLLGNIESPLDHKQYDLHIKGAGTTPYSREGDGRAVLRSSLREFLASEALFALGIPTSRALAVVTSETQVEREEIEQGATLLRVTESHIRFGHFEYGRHSGDSELLKSLADYVIDRHFPSIANSERKYAELFEQIAIRTAHMIAKWQAFGFAHGVMNTDNMSILGETFDYGPFGFLDRFDPQHICNHSDHSGRYAFDQQPGIAHWNLGVLAHAFAPLADHHDIAEGMHRFNETFNADYLDLMRQKLGITTQSSQDQGLIFSVLNFMTQQGLDYSYFFRKLANLDESNSYELLKDLCPDRDAFDQTMEKLLNRWNAENHSSSDRRESMNKVNPKYVLRKHLAQTAIQAAQEGDYSKAQELHKVLQKPYAEQVEYDQYAQLPPDWADDLAISCSS